LYVYDELNLLITDVSTIYIISLTTWGYWWRRRREEAEKGVKKGNIENREYVVPNDILS